MSDAISRKIKQLEIQNEKFKKLLEATRQITNEDAAKCLELKSEAKFLKKVVSDLENQKKQLEDELLNQYIIQGGCSIRENTNVDIQSKLNDALNDIQKESTEIMQLDIQDENLKNVISELERDKEVLLQDIRSVKKVNEDNKALAQENLKIKQELVLLESKCPPNACSSQDLVQKIESIENLQQNLQADINTAKQSNDLLGVPIENTVLELKICALEKQKDTILNNLRARLLQAANEISLLHSNTSDDQLRLLLNELDIHKTILMMNLNDLKEMQSKHSNDSLKATSSFTSDSSETLQQVTESSEEIYDHDLPTVSEESESQNDLLAEHEQLVKELDRLELERAELLEQINVSNAFNSTLMKEEVQKMSLDDATNQLYMDQEQLLEQRIKELETDNERIRGALGILMEEARSDQGDLEVLEEGERLIRELK